MDVINYYITTFINIPLLDTIEPIIFFISRKRYDIEKIKFILIVSHKFAIKHSDKLLFINEVIDVVT